MARRIMNPLPTSLVEMPNITPGTWTLIPGEAGDPSVGLYGNSGPTIEVEIPGREGDYVMLASMHEAIYRANPEDIKNSDMDYEFDSGERYLPGSPDQNGLLMAGAKGLLEASQTVLKELYDERDGVFRRGNLERIQSQIATLEQAIRDSIIFSE